MSNVISFKSKLKKSSTTKEAKEENMLGLKLQYMANLADLILHADMEVKDLTKGHTMKMTAFETGNVYEITIKRVFTNEE